MTLRRIANQLLDHAAEIMPAAHRPWTRAMRAELAHISDPLDATAFALGCVRASYAQRIVDMITVALMTRWVLALLALSWAVFTAAASSLFLAIKANPHVLPEDLGRGEDANNEVTLRFIHAYPAWESIALVGASIVFTAGAVQLIRRRAGALPLLSASVVMAATLALYDRRLDDPGFDRPLDSIPLILFWFACLAPVWWLSRRAPDLRPAT